MKLIMILGAALFIQACAERASDSVDTGTETDAGIGPVQASQKASAAPARAADAPFIVGSWTARTFHIDINSQRGIKGKDSTITADSSNWEERLGIKPITTVYDKNGTYQTEYRNPEDSVVGKRVGRWEIRGDSFFMMEIGPGAQSFSYKYKRLGSRRTKFQADIDFDEDGRADDYYEGILVKSRQAAEPNSR